MSRPPLLAVRGLKVGLRRRGRLLSAVDDVSFDLAPGEALGLVGESGCGKSLTAGALFRLWPSPPIEVQVESLCFEGEELASASEARLRALRGDRVGMVFQDPTTFLNPVLTVGRQITEPLALHRGLRGAAARAKAAAVLHEVGIPDPQRRLEAYPHELSGGQRQRVMLAAALACDPALLIADEPTTALDVTLQAQILRLLDRERRERGMGLLFITHDLGVVAQLCERVAVMYAGRIVEVGTTAELFARPRHPYTEGLLAAVRALDSGGRSRVGQPLPALPGTVPPLESFELTGCRFRGRCSRADATCALQTPPLASEAAATSDQPLASSAAPEAAGLSEPGPAPAATAVACHHPLQGRR